MADLLSDGRAVSAMLTAASDAVVICDDAGTIVDCNPAVETVLGYRTDELVGQPVDVLVPEESRPVHSLHRADFGAHPVARPTGEGLRIRARRRDGAGVPAAVSLVPIDTPGGKFVGVFIRDITERTRAEDRLESIVEVHRAVLAGGPLSESLDLAARHARRIVGGDDAWVMGSVGGRVEVLAATGGSTFGYKGASFRTTDTVAGRVIDGGGARLVDDLAGSELANERSAQLDLGPALFVPLGDADRSRRFGSLVVTRRRGRPAFNRVDLRTAELFAGAIAVALALGEGRLAAEDLHEMRERDRIARELHDTTIQRLFATGMGLQAAVDFAEPEGQRRILDAVDQIDSAIRQLRSTIFNLQTPLGARPGIRHAIREVATEIVGQQGAELRFAFEGAIESALDERQADELLPLVREAVANAVRHGHASRIDVLVDTLDGFRISIADDGVGISGEPSAGHGMDNMSRRAAALGGRLHVRHRHPTGTVVECHLPHGPAAGAGDHP